MEKHKKATMLREGKSKNPDLASGQVNLVTGSHTRAISEIQSRVLGPICGVRRISLETSLGRLFDRILLSLWDSSAQSFFR